MTGLSELKFSGSGAPIPSDLELMQKSMPGLVVVSAFPREIWYLNGRHIEYFCLSSDGKTISPKPPRDSYKGALCTLRKYLYGIPNEIDKIDPNTLFSERDLLKNLNVPFSKPFPRYLYANLDYIDDLLQLFENIDPYTQHIHFHCEHGKGRTTMVSVLYDIYHNSKQVSVGDIITRHYCQGGEDLMDTREVKGGTWTESGLTSRRNVAFAFYDFMNDSNGYGARTWKEWLLSKKEENYPYTPQSVIQHKHGEG